MVVNLNINIFLSTQTLYIIIKYRDINKLGNFLNYENNYNVRIFEYYHRLSIKGKDVP